MTVEGKSAVVLQPGYLPWMGFFDQMQQVDVFVYYDDVQFDKHGWRNRNRIKSPHGKPQWLTVPVLHRGKARPPINEVEIDARTPWARKHIGTLRQFYARAPHAAKYIDELADILSRPWTRLVDLDCAVTAALAGWLGITTPTVLSSELGIEGDSTDRLVRICRHLEVSRYLSGDAARDYLDVSRFSAEGIEVTWHNYSHPRYAQLHGEFLPYLSVIDLLLNCGEASARILGAGDTELAGQDS